MQNNNKKNDIMFDVFTSWSNGDKFSLRQHLSSAHKENKDPIKMDAEEVSIGWDDDGYPYVELEAEEVKGGPDE